MRVRLAPVEYKVCRAESCHTEYEGAQCPQCRQPFDPQSMRKELHDRLILVSVDPPIYEQTQRCRCPECKSLYDLREEDVVGRARCDQCKQALFSREQLHAVWRATQTLLQKARKLDRARRHLEHCPHCQQPVPAVDWCPLSSSVPHAEAVNGLPQNPITVWVRTFHTAESLQELRNREWMAGEIETEVEIETESERDED